MERIHLTRAGVACVIASALLVTGAAAAELQPATVRAYDAYVAQARQAFVALARAVRATNGDAPGAGPFTPAAPRGDTERLAGGVVHHWRGAIFIPGVELAQVLATAQAYDDYDAIYRAVQMSRLVHRDGNRYHVFARIKEDAGTVSAVLDVWSNVTYEQTGHSAYSLSEAQEIRQVQRAGESGERHLPPGRDSGYLWRANTFTKFVPQDGGVVVELENIGLSRSFPRLLAWFIEPIARRVGRASVERTLTEFRDAVLASLRPLPSSALLTRPPAGTRARRALMHSEGVLDDFEERVAAYAALRERLEQPLPPLQPTTDMQFLRARRAALASAIKAARANARRGDIFGFDTAWHLRGIIREALQGVDVEAMLDDLNEGVRGPEGFRPQVHDDYPSWASHAMPAILLVRLPQLPDGLEYRLIGYDLVLLDVRAGLIIDLVAAAVPSPGPGHGDARWGLA